MTEHYEEYSTWSTEAQEFVRVKRRVFPEVIIRRPVPFGLNNFSKLIFNPTWRTWFDFSTTEDNKWVRESSYWLWVTQTPRSWSRYDLLSLRRHMFERLHTPAHIMLTVKVDMDAPWEVW